MDHFKTSSQYWIAVKVSKISVAVIRLAVMARECVSFAGVTTKNTMPCQLAIRSSLHPLLGFCIFGCSSLLATFRDKQILRGSVVPFFAHLTGALTEGFDRNVAGGRNLLNRKTGRHLCQPRILSRLEVGRPIEAVTRSVPRCAYSTSRPP